MSTKREELEGQLSSSASKARIWEEFMKHPGWKLFEEIVKEQMNLRKTTICLTPINSVGQAFSQEFYKGEFTGMGTVLTIPQTEFESADMKRRVLSKELEVEDVTEEQIARADVSRVDGDAFGE